MPPKSAAIATAASQIGLPPPVTGSVSFVPLVALVAVSAETALTGVPALVGVLAIVTLDEVVGVEAVVGVDCGRRRRRAGRNRYRAGLALLAGTVAVGPRGLGAGPDDDSRGRRLTQRERVAEAEVVRRIERVGG